MKKKLCLLLALFFIVITCGCSQEGKIARNTKDLFSIYNAALDITVSLGESKASLEEKFNVDQYTCTESESLDGEVLSHYRIRTGDQITLTLDLIGGKVWEISLDPGIGDYITEHDIAYDLERSSDELMLEVWQNVESDWYFKEGLTVRSSKEEAYRVLGNPWDEMEEEYPVIGKVTTSTYFFTENFEVIPSDGDTSNAVASMAVCFLNDELFNGALAALVDRP